LINDFGALTSITEDRHDEVCVIERWSRKFGPVVKVDRMTREVIQNEETKEPLAGI
jgi:hypothetical protein